MATNAKLTNVCVDEVEVCRSIESFEGGIVGQESGVGEPFEWDFGEGVLLDDASHLRTEKRNEQTE